MKIENIKKLSVNQLEKLKEKSEFTIQCEIVSYCRKNDILIFSVPNEATRFNTRYKKSGVLSGVSDLILIAMGRTIYIELKDYKGKQSPSQIDFQNAVELLGHKYYIVRSVKEFKIILGY